MSDPLHGQHWPFLEVSERRPAELLVRYGYRQNLTARNLPRLPEVWPGPASESASASPSNGCLSVCGDPFLSQEGHAHRIPNLAASTGHNLFVFSVL